MRGILTLIGGIAAVLAVIVLVQIERVEAGYVGVKVDLLGSDKGVQAEEVGPGRYWVGFNEELYGFPTFSQNYVWTASEDEGSSEDESLTFQSVEGMDIGADVGITYSVDPTKVSALFERYRKGIEVITDLYLRNMVRDALVREASMLKVDLIYGTGKTALMERAAESVREQVAPHGIIIEKVYWIGSLRLPEKVIAAIDAEIAANSQARQRQNEIETATAEAQKERERAQGAADAILIEAKAQAEANLMLAESLTPEVLQATALAKWDGVLPRMTGGGAVPMINVDKIAD